jgi:hypothetical protein
VREHYRLGQPPDLSFVAKEQTRPAALAASYLISSVDDRGYWSSGLPSMQSYFSTYFSSGSQSSQQTPPLTSSGTTSTWSNTLSSRLQGLRKALTTNTEQDDPDNEDASHVSNVLRAYYTEMGRPFPPWLPPDPRKPSVALAPQQSSQYGQYENTYSGYGGNQYGATQQPGNRGSGGRGAGLSDLWESGPAQPAAPPAPQSLRTRPERPVPQSLLQSRESATSAGSPSQAQSQSSQRSARLLPSQRAGSYQASIQNSNTAGTTGAGSKDRLRARLQAGGSGQNSPIQSASGGPYGQSAYRQYRQDSSYSSAGSTGGGSPSPYVSASQPWAGVDDGFNGGYDGADEPYYNPRSGASGLARGQRPGGPR